MPSAQDAFFTMPKINGNEIRPGKMIEYDGGLWMAVKTLKVKPGKGGAYNQVELKNILNGTKLNQRFRSDESVEEVYLEKKDFQFLFANGDMLTFMDRRPTTRSNSPSNSSAGPGAVSAGRHEDAGAAL